MPDGRAARGRGTISRLEQLTTQPLPGLDAPTQIEFTLDGSALTFLWDDAGRDVRSLWHLDLGTGERRLLARGSARDQRRLDEELERQRRRVKAQGITAYERASRADVIVAVVDGGCLLSRDGTEAFDLGLPGRVQAARPAPLGDRIAWVGGDDVFLSALPPHAGGALTTVRATHDAEPGVFNGLAEYIAAEELDRVDGLWWAGDGAGLAWAHVDERDVPELVIPHLASSVVEVETHRYPFAGAANARVELRIAALNDGVPGAAEAIDLGSEHEYLARVIPHPLGGWLVASLPRDQRSLRWWSVTPGSPAAELWVERPEPWVNLHEATRILSDGRIVHAAENSGFRHLELREPDGRLERRLTAGRWEVTELVHVDEMRGEALFLATADGVLERHLYSVALDAARPTSHPARLTRDPGWHSVSISRDGSTWADTWSTRREAPRVVVRSRESAPEREIHPSSHRAAELGLAVPDLRALPAADGVTLLQVAVFAPGGEAAPRVQQEATSPRPAVVWVYGGPHSQNVKEAWDLTMHPLRQAMVDAGFVVIVVDNRGTANRGSAFEAPLRGRFGAAESDDQAAVVARLAADGELDPKRVGITGSSYGGYMTLMAMLRHPDRFAAGVAGAPVTAWDGYDTAYTERYLGLPRDNAPGYAASSALELAGRLRGALLLIHGALDENVHLRHTARLLGAMERSGLAPPLVLLPTERHSVSDPTVQLLRDAAALDHLCQALGVARPAAAHGLPRRPGSAVRRPRTGG